MLRSFEVTDPRSTLNPDFIWMNKIKIRHSTKQAMQWFSSGDDTVMPVDFLVV